MPNEFIIKINKDSNGNELSLENIPLEAAESLTIFLGSLKEFGALHENPNIRFSLKNGCIETAISYPETALQIDAEITDVINNKSDRKDYIKLFKTIQDRVQLNGLDYSILHKIGNNAPVDVTPIFKGRKFAYRRKTRTWHQEIVFITGLLVDNGGKSVSNIHVETANEEFIIESTREEAKAVRSFLYDPVYLVAVKMYYDINNPYYKYVDSYLTSEMFHHYKNFYSTVHSNQSLDKYDIIYEAIVEIINSDRNINEVLKIMRLYNSNFSDRGIIRTILMALKPIDKSNNQRLFEMYESLATKLREGSTNNII